MSFDHVQDHPGSLIFVGQVGRVNKDQLPEIRGEFQVFVEDDRLVLRVLIQANLTDAQHAGPVEKFGIMRMTSRESETSRPPSR